MSRHEIRNGEGQLVAYGFDRPLSEYWAQIDRLPTEDEVADWEVAPDEVISISICGTMSPRPYGTAGNLADALAEVGVWDLIPEAHKDAMAMDVPF